MYSPKKKLLMYYDEKSVMPLLGTGWWPATAPIPLNIKL